ncbi:acyl-CoA thioesterase [Vibrio atypicus]|uniref:acyl-CoA thioesterase n=1 Tax=Vibrio atypicus TaxID=558271 RepID=UPI00135901F3|nr:thioesterase family protein [Vibrio atypicus]
MKNIFTLPYRIRFSDCDPAGIVFYPQYFVMFNDLLEAWVDSILDGGFAHYIGQSRFGLPVVNLQADFKAISRMGDDVYLQLEVERVGDKSLGLTYRCVDASDQLRMEARQTLVTTSLVTHKAVPIPTELKTAIRNFCNPTQLQVQRSET